ncbi:hypothetical protein J2046_002724 [Rhizobium petrolearium]|uniref:hypothetical protein n=1 Tax=Neorhizobium petrolearium TaxID=515361 RepID=UPI001AE9B4D2|nr:hypothetical protein [Neorhizobium petrolearium]MBP1844465.1 hypothetical protein [Neorhizobium petrolearium]
MNIKIDMTEILRQAQELPDEITTLDEIDPALREYYAEADGKIRINADRRKELIAHLSDVVERGNVMAENAKLRDQQNRRLVADTIRTQLARFVKPELLSAAVTVFMSQHKFGIRDEKVIVLGKLGISEAAMAAVNWIEDEGEVFSPGKWADSAAPGGFSAEIAKLKNVH